MNRPKTTATLLIVAITLALMPISIQAQRLYNKERDEQAQTALPLAQALKTGELFDRQLKNLSSLAKKDFDTEFLVTRFQINAFTLNMLKWGDAHAQVCQVELSNTEPGLIPEPADVQTALADLKKSIEEAQKALESFKDSIKKNEDKADNEDDDEDSSILASLFNNLGDLQSLTDFAEQIGEAHPDLISTKTIASLKQVQEIAETLKTVYDAYTAKVEAFNKLNDDLTGMRIILKKVAIQSLQVDEDHWKNIASIRARREVERANVLAMISEYKGIVRRLGLVDFNDAPNSINKFCIAAGNAMNSAERPDMRPFQMITQHMAELLAHSQLLETDNRQLETQALNAMPVMRAATTEDQRRAAAQPALDALSTAMRNFAGNDAARLCGLDGPNCINTTRDNLVTAVRTSTTAGSDALTALVIRARKNSVQIRNMMGDVPQALYLLAALIARGSTPNRLAEVRFAQELHSYSIRKSAVRARAYELTVSTGAQRLALFHKGGIKPTDIAELVFAASNVAISPAILAR
jgi:tetratricopeptide (TPR) repeat protein